MAETNPFTTEEGAKNWVAVVEGNDVFRETHIYPRIEAWTRTLRHDAIIADIGSGQGKCSELLGDNQVYIGVEPSVPLSRRAVEAYGNRSSRGGANKTVFTAADAYSTGLRSESVDAVLSTHVWFHLGSLSRAAAEAERILKPGGIMHVISANPDGYDVWRNYYTIQSQAGKMFRGTLDFGGDEIIEDSTFYQHSWGDILLAVHEAGMEVTSVSGFPLERPTSMQLIATKA